MQSQVAPKPSYYVILEKLGYESTIVVWKNVSEDLNAMLSQSIIEFVAGRTLEFIFLLWLDNTLCWIKK